MKTKLLSPREYCPDRKIPLDREEIILLTVQKEDIINHLNDPIPELPPFKEVKIPFTTATAHQFGKEVMSFMRP